MKKAYILAFSSFYKAMYAGDKLREQGFAGNIRRTPPQMTKTCGYGVYIKVEDIKIVIETLRSMEIDTRGVYLEDKVGKEYKYKRIM